MGAAHLSISAGTAGAGGLKQAGCDAVIEGEKDGVEQLCYILKSVYIGEMIFLEPYSIEGESSGASDLCVWSLALFLYFIF